MAKSVLINLDDSVHKELRAFCDSKGVSVKYLMETLLIDFLKNGELEVDDGGWEESGVGKV